MTLEQIKNRQERTNETLRNLLKDTINIVEVIVGEQLKSEHSLKTDPYSGLLEELTNKQNMTDFYIGELISYNELLVSKIHSRELECGDNPKSEIQCFTVGQTK